VGKPVVCSGRGETQTVIERYGSGIMVPPGDPRALAEAILRFGSDPKFYEVVARNSRKVAIQHYPLSILARGIETLMEASR
jgi:glycosyltransferase involved in cell wall biosynthesis